MGKSHISPLSRNKARREALYGISIRREERDHQQMWNGIKGLPWLSKSGFCHCPGNEHINAQMSGRHQAKPLAHWAQPHSHGYLHKLVSEEQELTEEMVHHPLCPHLGVNTVRVDLTRELAKATNPGPSGHVDTASGLWWLVSVVSCIWHNPCQKAMMARSMHSVENPRPQGNIELGNTTTIVDGLFWSPKVD